MNSQVIRVSILAIWSFLILGLWGWWLTASLNSDNGEPITEAGQGMILMFTSGCCGGTWMVGLLAMVLIFSFIRR